MGDEKKTILVLENFNNFRELLVTRLTALGYRVLGASTLEEARKVISGTPCHLAILDVNLPDGSGLDFARELKSTHPGTPVILSTAYWDNSALRHIDTEQIVDMLFKPYSFDELQKRIKEILK